MVKKRHRQFTRCSKITNAWSALNQWYETPLGKLLEHNEQGQLDELLSDLFGYHLLLLGHIQRADWIRNSRISHRMTMDICGTEDLSGKTAFKGQPEALPVSADSLDVMVLPHVLEFSEHPHEVLREVERCLVPEGYVVILMFNPLSFWSLWRALLGRRGQIPWCGHFIGTTRLKDWLALLGFEVVETRHYFFRPPLQRPGVMERLSFMERLGQRLWPVLSGGFVLVARKQVATLTPLRPRWRSTRKLASGLAEPMSRQRRESKTTLEKSR